MKLLIKIVVAIIVALCIFQMPYGYYRFARIAVCAGMIYMAYTEQKKPVLCLLCICIAILFNPIIKVYLHKDVWHVMDLALAALLAIWVIVDLVSLLHAKGKKDIQESH